ncbi:MAG TPA: DUF2971 domain-containing protein [Gammaproteobacteria bacterium]|nr:DUF2971 domain-containing protein [Gammaproteobacteria bacterium]
MSSGHEDDEKLQRIFMPTADARIEKLIKDNGRLAHYTTAEAALSIIESKSIWLRNAMGMSDFSEVRYGFNQLSGYFQDEAKRNRFSTTFDGIDANIVQRAIQLFDQWWGHIQTNTFMTCFSEHGSSEDQYGRLSMWRAFGKNIAGVAIVIRCPEKYSALPLKAMLRPVIYMDRPDWLDHELQKVVANVNSNHAYLETLDPSQVVVALYQMLHLTAVTLKHQGFHEEREWRLCYFPMHSKSDHVLEETRTISGIPQVIHKVVFENKPAQLITKIELPELLDRVIIGPSQYALSTAQALSKALKEAKVENPDSKIFISDIPIRG